jgi:hypothetical protein
MFMGMKAPRVRHRDPEEHDIVRFDGLLVTPQLDRLREVDGQCCGERDDERRGSRGGRIGRCVYRGSGVARHERERHDGKRRLQHG